MHLNNEQHTSSSTPVAQPAAPRCAAAAVSLERQIGCGGTSATWGLQAGRAVEGNSTALCGQGVQQVQGSASECVCAQRPAQRGQAHWVRVRGSYQRLCSSHANRYILNDLAVVTHRLSSLHAYVMPPSTAYSQLKQSSAAALLLTYLRLWG